MPLKTKYQNLSQLFHFLIGQSPHFDMPFDLNLPRFLVKNSLMLLFQYRNQSEDETQTLIQKNRVAEFLEAYQDFRNFLQTQNQSHLMLKGLTLALYYPQCELRPFSDLDLFLQDQSQTRIYDLFSNQATFKVGNKADLLDYQVSVEHKKTKRVSEVHSSLGEAGRYRELETLCFQKPVFKTFHFEGQNYQLPCLPAELEFIYICQHFISHGMTAKFLWLIDIHSCLLQNQLDLLKTLSLAKELKMDLAVLAILKIFDFLKIALPISLPDSVLCKKIPAIFARNYLESIYALSTQERIFTTRFFFAQGVAKKMRMIGFYTRYFLIKGRHES